MSGATKTNQKFKPLKDRVFVSYAEESEKTAGEFICRIPQKKNREG